MLVLYQRGYELKRLIRAEETGRGENKISVNNRKIMIKIFIQFYS